MSNPHGRCLELLRRGPLVRVGDRWKFGLASIGDVVVDRLIADGRAIRDGDKVTLAKGTAR